MWQVAQSQSDTLVFHDNDEAGHYLNLLGGEMGGVQKIARIVGGRKLYFVHRSRFQELCDGFWCIQHLVYDHQRLAMYCAA